MRTSTLSQLLALALLVGPAPLAADWLVTRDGSKIETKGGWKVEGRRVVFTLPNGTLSSLRTEEVDLDLSALETERAREIATAPPAPPPPKPEPRLRLTDKDLPPVSETAEGEPAAAPREGSAVSSGLEVVSWERTENQSGDGIDLFGTVRNNGNANVTSPTLVVTIYDADGKLLATADGHVNAPAIPPGKTANFRAAFPGVPDFSAARFDAQGTPFAIRAVGEGEEGAEGEGVEAALEPLPAPAEEGSEGEPSGYEASEAEDSSPPPGA